MRKPFAIRLDAKATALLRKQGLYSMPVDVSALADSLGADVVYEDLEVEVSGLLLREGDHTTIAINKKHHPNRQRFTLAHECGHLILHANTKEGLWVDKALFFRDASSRAGEDFDEVQANQFAAGILMPEEFVRQAVDDLSSLSDADVVRLAARFGVSERAMMVRLLSLELISTAVS
jgi:Zn-dependent peptidase ImmA (M78 family)